MADVDTIEYLKTAAEQAETDARKARQVYDDALKDAAPFHVGDVAVAFHPTQGRLLPCKILITRASVQGSDYIRYHGRWQNKDGSWSGAAYEVWGELHPEGWTPELDREPRLEGADMP